jgi:hypothetical protein
LDNFSVFQQRDDVYLIIIIFKRAWGMAEVVECLPGKLETLSLNLSTAKKEKKVTFVFQLAIKRTFEVYEAGSNENSGLF